MNAKSSWVIGVVIVILIIIAICWGMNSAPVAAPDQAGNVPAGSSGPTGATAPTTNAPLGTYPIHIKGGTPSVYYTPVNSATGTTGTSIQVNNPPTNTVIASPLSVTGKAKGPWYFEASFQVILTDATGKVLAVTNAAALGNWQTADFVPFAGKLTFPSQTTGEKGVLILKKDNPSGLAANDASIEIGVTFK